MAEGEHVATCGHKATKSGRPKHSVAKEAFARLYETRRSINAMAAELGISAQAVSMRAHRLGLR